MKLFDDIFRIAKNIVTPNWTRPELLYNRSIMTLSGQRISSETAKRIATYYRCLNLITDDLSMVPFQQFIRNGNDIQRVLPNSMTWNMPYSMEIRPNPYQSPFKLRKRFWTDLFETGDAYLWAPAGTQQLYCLSSKLTYAEFRVDESLWFYTPMRNGLIQAIPSVEVLHLIINHTNTFKGRGVLEYARETLGVRQAGNSTRSSMFKRGLMPSAIAQFDGDMNGDARKRVRDAYWEAVSGADEAGGVVVLDGKVKDFKLAEIKPADAQFLESIQATDVDIANFFAMPLYKLNQGKQSYESNVQQDEDYMRSTLDPHLVQMEQEARITWVPLRQQTYSYWKFNREAFLRMNAKERATYLKDKILCGEYTPNDALAIDDLPGYPGGDVHFIPSNMAVIKKDGTIEPISKSNLQPNENEGDGSRA